MVSPLRRHIGISGGPHFDEAVRRGEAAVDQLRTAAAAELTEAVNQIVRLLEEQPPSPRTQVVALSAANKITTIAGLVGWTPLARAAQSLFAVLEDFALLDAWDPAIVRVHCEALRFLCRPDAPDAAPMLAGLAKIAHRLRARTEN